MRTIPAVALLLSLFLVPVTGHAQSAVVYGSGGPTLADAGYSVAAGGGLAASRLTILGSVERTHLLSRETTDGRGGVSRFRGGTLTVAAAELRATVRGQDRIGPYGVAGFAAGVSRPNVTAAFPNRVSNDVRALFFGGGLHAPIGERLALFADARWMVGAEAGESLAIAPLRAGLMWRF